MLVNFSLILTLVGQGNPCTWLQEVSASWLVLFKPRRLRTRIERLPRIRKFGCSNPSRTVLHYQTLTTGVSVTGPHYRMPRVTVGVAR